MDPAGVNRYLEREEGSLSTIIKLISAGQSIKLMPHTANEDSPIESPPLEVPFKQRPGRGALLSLSPR